MNLEGKIIRYPVQEANTIAELKDQIGRIEGMNQYEQRLMFDGRELESHLSMQQCNIQPGSIIRLDRTFGFKIRVRKFGDKAIEVVFFPGEKVKDVKERIFMNDRTLPVERQRLFFLGKELENEKVASGYGIKAASLVDVTLKYFPSQEEPKPFWKWFSR